MNLLQMSISAAVMIAAIIILRAALIYKLPKKAFLFLWGLVLLRLLLPVSIPSPFSVYSWLPQGGEAQATEAEARFYAPQVPAAAERITERLDKERNYQLPSTSFMERLPISLWVVVWAAGCFLCIVFFLIAYGRGMRKFKTALPVDTDFIHDWRTKHPLKRPLAVRRSNQVLTPLSYGVFRPVILLPEKLDLTNTEVLNYILTHEYVHIRHFDILTKAVMILALSIHWFNPLVWIMFLLLNRDIELVCDETVIRMFGEKSRSAYAYTLIDMEIHQAGLVPLCNNFSKNAIEERIGAIMKMKKTSMAALVLALLLAVSLTVIFATSAAGVKPNQTSAAEAAFSEEERNWLRALQWNGYEDMSVSEYQNKVWQMTDTKEYQELLERVAQNEALQQQAASDAFASFLCNILVPLTSEKWQTREFGGSIGSYFSETMGSGERWTNDETALEFSFTLDIKKADELTVGEYAAAHSAVRNALLTALQDKTEKELCNKDFMQKAIDAKIEKIKKEWSSDKLWVSAEYFYTPLPESDRESFDNHAEQSEPRRCPQASEEDYRLLLALKTLDYQKMTVADFNKALLEWASSNPERLERIDEDIAFNDYGVSLSAEEKNFIVLTVGASGRENAELVKSGYMGVKEKDPETMIILPDKERQNRTHSFYSSLSYHLSYHISDKKALTIGERDACLARVMSGIEQFWREAKIEDILKMTDAEAVERLNQIAAAESSQKISFQIAAEQVYLKKVWDEKDRAVEEQILLRNGTTSADENAETFSNGKTESGSSYEGEKADTGLEGQAEPTADPWIQRASAAEVGAELTADEWEELYSVYKPFGLVYDKEQDCFYYHGKLVRTFVDVMQSNGKSFDSGEFKGIMRQLHNLDGKGEIDVYAVRDYGQPDSQGNGTLIGVKENIK